MGSFRGVGFGFIVISKSTPTQPPPKKTTFLGEEHVEFV